MYIYVEPRLLRKAARIRGAGRVAVRARNRARLRARLQSGGDRAAAAGESDDVSPGHRVSRLPILSVTYVYVCGRPEFSTVEFSVDRHLRRQLVKL